MYVFPKFKEKILHLNRLLNYNFCHCHYYYYCLLQVIQNVWGREKLQQTIEVTLKLHQTLAEKSCSSQREKEIKKEENQVFSVCESIKE